jgi:3-phosphoshikimate 1-carboxyvinyltransferase
LTESYLLTPATRLAGRLRVPGDKSISHRCLLLVAVARGRSEIEGFLASEDCLATMAALRAMGVKIEHKGERVIVHGVGLHGLRAPSAALDLGNSGTAIRLLAGLLAGQHFDSELVGDASLMQRPMRRVADPLNAMGAQVETCEGRPPLRIHGGRALRGIDYTLPVASAQVKSALLLAGLYAEGETLVRGSGASRDHTERMMMSMGVTLSIDEDETIRLAPGSRPEGMDIRVPGDLSSAAFFLLGGCLAADEGLVIEGVGINPTRIGILGILDAMGAQISIENRRMEGREPVADLHVRRAQLRGIEVPAAMVPLAIDEFPALFIAAAAAQGTTTISGAEELRHKESDRIAVMVAGLRALGAEVEERPDGAVIHGGTLGGGEIDSHGDHRIAMAFAMASLVATAPVRVRDTANVATSFPGFPELARSAGLALQVVNP